MIEAIAPRRILLYGATGSGKSTAALRIGAKLGLPVTLADEIGWLPQWQSRPDDEQRAHVAAAVESGAWVFDSAYSKWSELVVPHAELIVGLDYPRWFSLQRLVRRTVRRCLTHEEVCNGNYETARRAIARDSIIVWHFRSWKRKRRRMREWAHDPGMPRTILFRRPSDLENWIEALQPVSGLTTGHPLA